jgi:hypothetical protein
MGYLQRRQQQFLEILLDLKGAAAMRAREGWWIKNDERRTSPLCALVVAKLPGHRRREIDGSSVGRGIERKIFAPA